MKSNLVFLCVLLVAGFVSAEQPVDPVKALELEVAGVKGDMTKTIFGTLSDTYNGSLSASRPTWDRSFGATYDASCNLAMTDSSNNGQYYEVIPIEVSATENLECEVTSFGGDSTLHVFCDPFNPLAPLDNVLAYDDDGGVSPLSAFSAADGVELQPGNTYYVVLSTFSPGVTGDFTIDFTSATVVVVPVELQSFSIE
jgi:hypothetical protein